MISDLMSPNNEEQHAVFRCSSLGDLMSSGRGATKSDKLLKIKATIADTQTKIKEAEEAGKSQYKINGDRHEKIKALQLEYLSLENELESPNDILGESAKTAIKRIILKDMYGALEEVESDATRHGKDHEPIAIMQYGELLRANVGNEHAQFRKNIERKSRGLLSGEADVVFQDAIFEFKCPFGTSSFFDQCINPNLSYILQVHGYMYIWDLQEAYIVTALFKNKNHKDDKVFENTLRKFRFHTNYVERDEDAIVAILNRLDICKAWLDENKNIICKNAGFHRYADLRAKYGF